MHPVASEFHRHVASGPTQASDFSEVRFVILDTEMTGLDSRVDRLVSIGAIGCQGGDLILEDAFEAFIQISHNTSAVHLHGITRERAESEGAPESQVLEHFLNYLRDGIIVGHHVSDDISMLELACQRCFDFEVLPNLVIDTMQLTLSLEQAGFLEQAPEETEPDYSLDGLCGRFGLSPHDRHTAAGDAFLTGQVFLKLMRRAKAHGWTRLGQLTEYAESKDLHGE